MESSIAYAQNLFTANAFSAVIFAAFMPIPEAYKVAALAAAVLEATVTWVASATAVTVPVQEPRVSEAV